jgi:sugar lactone lactonase YvrE
MSIPMKHMRSLSRVAFGVAVMAMLGAGKAPFAGCSTGVSVLVRGAPLHGANGIAFDSSDRLHVASVVGREIVTMDPNSGEILDRLTRSDGVETPDDLAFGPDGALYWTAIIPGQVVRRSIEGVVDTVASLGPGANPIAFSPDGRLYVGRCILAAGLFELDPDGNAPPRSIREFPNERCGVNAFDVGADGLIYAPRFFASEVVAIDPDTGDMRTVADGFGVPAAVKFDAHGVLHVVDTAFGELWQVDIATGEKHLLADIPVNTDNLAFDASGGIFVSSYDDGSIHEVLSDGTLREVSPGGLTQPGGVAILGKRLFVADHYSLVEFDAASGRERDVQKSVIGFSPLAEPMTVSAAGRNLISSSWTANAVQVWNPVTDQVVESHFDFNIPLNAISFRGGLAVAELGTGSVVLEQDGTRTTLIDGLLVPTGLAAEGSTLYVADAAAGTITRVTRHDRRVVARELAAPEGLAWSTRGRLLVVESGAGRVSEVDLGSGERRVLADGLALGLPSVPGLPPTFLFNGIATDTTGRVYVSGDVDNVVYVLSEPHPRH